MLNEFFYGIAGDSPGPGPEPEAYVINRSLRFNSEDSAFLTRTPTELGNRKTWTLSTWVKRNKLGTNQCLFGTNNTWVTLSFNTDDQIDVYFQSGATSNYLKSNAVYRDPSAWYHIVLMFDTTQAVASDRVKCYVNGEELTWSRADYPAVNYETGVNALVVHDIGARSSENVIYLDAQLAEMYLIDGQSLTASDFGEYDSDGVWQPKEYTIDKGTNYTKDVVIDGTLYVDGNDPANGFDGDTTTAIQLNNNAQNQSITFTPSTPIPYSSSVEVFMGPSGNTGITRWSANGGPDQSLTGTDYWQTILSGSGELTEFIFKQGAQLNSAGWKAIRIDGTTLLVDAPPSNSFYLDFNDTSSNGALGYDKSEIVSTRAQSAFNIVEWTGNGGTQSIESVGFQPDFLWIKGIQRTTDHYIQDSVRGVTLTSDANTPGNETENPDGVISLDPSGFTVGPGTGLNASNVVNEPYIAWCWKAGGVAEIISPGENNSSAYNESEVWSDRITFSGGTLTPGAEVTAFDGDLTTGITDGNNASSTPLLMTFDPPITATTSLRVFTTGTNSTPVRVNGVLFANSSPGKWDDVAGNVINTVEVNHIGGIGLARLRAVEVDGKILVNAGLTLANPIPSIASEVSADPEYGFSVATYEGSGSVGGTVAHGLEATPGFIIVKKRNSPDASWYVYHSELDAGKALNLNNTDPQFTPGQAGITAVSETTFTLSSERDEVNGSGNDYVAYSWAEVPGFSKFGKYTGSSNTVKVTTGFKPKYVLIKCISDGGQEWIIKDSVRGGDKTLIANTSGTQTTDRNVVFNSDGFSPVGGQGPTNFDGRTYVYAAFADSVGNNWEVNNLVAQAIGDPEANRNMDVVTYTGNGSEITVSGLSFQPSLVWIKSRTAPYDHRLFDSVRGVDAIYSSSNSTEGANSVNENFVSYDADGFTLGAAAGVDGINGTGTDYVAWCWKAGDETTSNTDGTIDSTISVNPEYGFSIVSYTGNGNVATVGHGLQNEPKIIILKSRDSVNDWYVYTYELGNTQYLSLNKTIGASSFNLWNNTSPTSDVFSLSSGTDVNKSGDDFVAYCWSEVPGYSKIGSYTGNGSADGPEIKTGFKPRFLMFKCSSNVGNWIIIDSARDPVYNGTSKKLAPNLNFEENNSGNIGSSTQTLVEFLDDGFKMRSTGGTSNDPGATYIFMAFAGIPEGEDVDSLIDTPTNYESEIVPVEVDVPGFAAATYVGTNSDQDIKIGFQPDLVWIKDRDAGSWHIWTDSVRGTDKQIYSNSSSVEAVNTDRVTAFNSDGFSLTSNASGGVNSSGVNFVAWCWKAGNTTQTIAAGDANSSAYNQSQVWSSNVSGGSMLISWTKAFDGNVSPSSAAQTGGSSSTVTLNPPIEVGSGVEIAGASEAFVTFGLVDGSSVTDKPDDYSTFSPVDGLNSGQIETISLNAFQALSGIKVDGKILVDSGASPPNVNSVDSQVSVSPEYGFSVITGVQPGTANLGCTVAHGLEKAPSMYIVKDRDLGVGWGVYHSGLDDPANEALALNSDGQVIAGGYWRGELPTSDVLSISASIVGENDDFVVYAWSEIEGFSKFGRYSGNGQSTGPKITTGFKPRFLMIKQTDAANGWFIWDTARDSTNPNDNLFTANTSNAEQIQDNHSINFLSDGFQPDDSNGAFNGNGNSYIYMAFGKGFTEIVDTQPDNNGGNYATWSPLVRQTSGGLTFSNGNLDLISDGNRETAMSSFALTGKKYWEIVVGGGVNSNFIGITRSDGFNTVANNNSGIKYVGYTSYSYGYQLDTGNFYNSSNAVATYEAGNDGDILGFAFDADALELSIYKNNALLGTYTSIDSGTYFPAITHSQTGATSTANFGQRPFAYAPPAGYKSLCTTNLNEPTIADGSTAMAVTPYDGTSSAQTISGLNHSPDVVWVKSRSDTKHHFLCDTVRGADRALLPSAQSFEENQASITGFTSDGFILSSRGGLNATGQTYAGWTWDAGNETQTIAPGGANAAVYQMREIWSDHLTSPGDVKKATAAFDGVIDGSRTEGVGGLTLTPPGGLQVYSSVEVIDAQGITESQVTINGVVQPFVPHTGNTWVTIFSGSGTLDSVFTRRTDNPAFDAGFTGIRVDGRELVNADINPPVGYPSISSEVRANPASGFSVVSYTGSDSGTATIAHGLNATPELIIAKGRNLTDNWWVQHVSEGHTKLGFLNLANAFGASSLWGAAPSSGVFSIGSSGNAAYNYIAYCFAPVEGYSKFGSYEGNGSADGPFIYTGFKPAFILIKGSTFASNWFIQDDQRDGYNVQDGVALRPNLQNPEDNSDTYNLDILSNGFKLRTAAADSNTSGQTFVWAAFASNPFKTSRAR